MPNPTNWYKEMEQTISAIQQSNTRPKLLLHACCGPCSSAVLELLRKTFDLSVLYYNPNIWPQAEYERRGDELARFLQQIAGDGSIKLIELPYDSSEFYGAIEGLENEPEKGNRCTVCYRLRLEQAAAYAASHGFEWFCSTLSISPHKDAMRLNTIGLELAEAYHIKWLMSDFKKKEGYKRSLTLSEEHHLYRQEYCGCEYSAKARGIDQSTADSLTLQKK